MNEILKISQSAFDEIRFKYGEKFGFLAAPYATLDMDGVTLQAEGEKPSVLKIALSEGLKKDGTSTSE